MLDTVLKHFHARPCSVGIPVAGMKCILEHVSGQSAFEVHVRKAQVMFIYAVHVIEKQFSVMVYIVFQHCTAYIA